MIKGLLTIVVFVAVLYSCVSTPDEPLQTMAQIKECRNKTNVLAERLKFFGYDKYVNSSLDHMEQYLKGNFYEGARDAVNAMDAYIRDSSVQPNPYDIHSELFFTKKCDVDSYEQSFIAPIRQAELQTDMANVAQQNRIVDNALNDVIAGYKKRAVEHKVISSGSGSKVESFLMKNGKTVICRTSVTNAGKAVDCR